jgi:hypothetical protein
MTPPMRLLLVPASLVLLTAVTAAAQEPVPVDESPRPTASEPVATAVTEREPEFGVRAMVELGFLGVLAHEITLGSDGTRIDYPSDGGQSNLYPFLRITAELDIWRQHIITFVYQPLDIETRATLTRDLRIDGLVFPAGEAVRFFYGFPFYRLGWAFDVLESPDEELAFGIGGQIRNANIEFESSDGSLYRVRRGVGAVPLLRARGRFAFERAFYFAFEVDGFYAPISVLNGSDTEVTGAILDASVRVGFRFWEHLDTFLNIRYLGGGATGQGDPTPTSDGTQTNWLHFLTVSIGGTIDSRP